MIAALVVTRPALAEETGPLDPGFSGYPLAYERTMNYDRPYPNVQALYVNQLREGSPAVEAGLRRGSMIESVADTPVRTLDDVRSAITRHAGETVTFVVHSTTARYRKRLRENPLARPRDASIYERRELRVQYRRPEPERLTVVAGPNHRLYHHVYLQHSPDTRDNPTYPNPAGARKDALNPCPICFPGREASILEKVVEDELAAPEGMIRGLLQEYPTLPTPPEDVRAVAEDLFPHRLHKNVVPRLIVLDTAAPYAFSLTSGKIVLSRGFLNVIETRSELAFTLGRLLAHIDLGHNPNPVQTSRVRRLVEEAIQRTTGVSFTFDQVEGWAPKVPGFTYYRDLLSRGYGENEERAAFFLGMVYLNRADYALSGADRWRRKLWDLEDAVHPYWLNFLLRHPLPSEIEDDIRVWKRRIPKRFPPSRSPDGSGA